MGPGLYVGGIRILRFALEFAPDMVLQIFSEDKMEADVRSAIKLGKKKTPPVRVVSRERLDSLVSHADDERHAGVVTEFKKPEGTALEHLSAREEKVLVLLDHIQDTNNLGAIARSSLLLGATGIVFPSARSASITPGAIKASSGALLLNRFSEVTNLGQALRDLKKEGYWIAGLSADLAGKEVISLAKLREYRPLALVMGAEQTGLRPSTLETCDFTVTIPLKTPYESVSLNVSVATALALQSLNLV